MGRETIDSEELRNPLAGSEAMMVSPWQLIFELSRVNNGAYNGDRLPAQNWHWPQGTWLQKRLRYLRKSHDGYSKASSD